LHPTPKKIGKASACLKKIFPGFQNKHIYTFIPEPHILYQANPAVISSNMGAYQAGFEGYHQIVCRRAGLDPSDFGRLIIVSPRRNKFYEKNNSYRFNQI
jgi:hypothetical protein